VRHSHCVLTASEKNELLRGARQALTAALTPGAQAPLLNSTNFSATLQLKRGAFVTLHNQHHELRGCIGTFETHDSLFETVARMAVAAGLHDPRFPKVTPGEMENLKFEISVLSESLPCHPEDIIVGQHGMMIKKGFSRGVLLPQVATEWNMDRKQFLAAVCQKAGLAPDAWQREDVELRCFTAEVFSDDDI